jgi:hypothetical protein
MAILLKLYPTEATRNLLARITDSTKTHQQQQQHNNNVTSLHSYPWLTPPNPTIIGTWFKAAHRFLGSIATSHMCGRNMHRSDTRLRERGVSTSK